MKPKPQNPEVSIITTVYNAEKTVEDTILSVICQTSYDDLEYIIIDGGSTDGTMKIIEKYACYFSHVISEPDKGIADGFNKGIALAKGEWIGMINADDWYELNAVETVMKTVTNIDMICCGNLNLIGKNGYTRSKKSKISWLNFGMYIMHPTCFIKKEVYQKVGLYDTDLKIAVDFDMFMRIRRAGYKVKYIDCNLAYMRTGGASGDISQSHSEELAVMRKYLDTTTYFFSYLFKHINMIRWRYLRSDPFKA